MPFPKNPPYKSPEFLAWAKTQRGWCCACNEKPGVELHHYEKKGMGQKCSDLLVCRMCKKCHEQHQGKHRASFTRDGQVEIWINMLEDNRELLTGYIAHLETRKPNSGLLF